MNIGEMTIKEIESLFTGAKPEAELIEACQNDARAAVRRIPLRWEREERERARVAALYKYEYEAKERGATYIAGVDEAGRGPLAGPVVVAAVILPLGVFIPRLNDSKKLSAKVRENLYDVILEKAVTVRHAVIDEKTIDRINIYQATINGMYDAIFSLQPEPQEVLIDAVHLDKLTIPSLSIIKGDAKSASIAAASIIAKVERDRLMDAYDKLYPAYGFAQHKGYGTAQHMDAIKKYGPCPIHRRTFEPIRSLMLS